jgi:hypothetical protein
VPLNGGYTPFGTTQRQPGRSPAPVPLSQRESNKEPAPRICWLSLFLTQPPAPGRLGRSASGMPQLSPVPRSSSRGSSDDPNEFLTKFVRFLWYNGGKDQDVNVDGGESLNDSQPTPLPGAIPAGSWHFLFGKEVRPAPDKTKRRSTIVRISFDLESP